MIVVAIVQNASCIAGTRRRLPMGPTSSSIHDAAHDVPVDAHARLRELAEVVRAEIAAWDGSPWDEGTFSELAVELFHAQHACGGVYGRWCDHELGRRGHEARDVRSWRDVPALPIGAFKRSRVA